MTNSFPLAWPSAWPRTKRPQRSQFRVSPATARNNLHHQLRLLGATSIVVSTNVELKSNGQPYARQLRADEDPGVAVYFVRNGEEQCFPCDRWQTVTDNVHAIGKSIEAIRGLGRWGASDMVNAAFRGFKALPESIIVTPSTMRPWYDVLEVQQTASMDVIEAAYKRLLHKVHPDKGGSDSAFQELQNAYKQAKANSG